MDSTLLLNPFVLRTQNNIVNMKLKQQIKSTGWTLYLENICSAMSKIFNKRSQGLEFLHNAQPYCQKDTVNKKLKPQH